MNTLEKQLLLIDKKIDRLLGEVEHLKTTKSIALRAICREKERKIYELRNEYVMLDLDARRERKAKISTKKEEIPDKEDNICQKVSRWLRSGLCYESALIMAGKKKSNFTYGFRNNHICLHEEKWAILPWPDKY